MTEFLVTSSVLIAAVIILSFLSRGKISRRLRYALWIPVLLRLLMPFPLPGSPFNVMNAVPGGTPVRVQSANTALTGAAAASGVSAPVHGTALLPAASAGTVATSAGPMSTDEILRLVWLIGSIALALWFLGTNLVFYRRLRRTRKACDAVNVKLPVYVSSSVLSPCLFGLFRPAVYLTPKAAENECDTRYVLAHELCHYRHGDHIWSVLRCVCLAAYWWDPLVWAAAILSRADSELACDEAAVRQIGEENRLAYGRTLVGMIAVKQAPSNLLCTATTMASGKRGIKERLNMIVRNPKTLIPVFAAVIVVCAICIVSTFTGALSGNGKAAASLQSAGTSRQDSVSQGKTVSVLAQKLFDSRVKYIGDAPADDALLSTVGMPKEPSGCTLELETKSEPYVLRVVFGGKVNDSSALDKAMNRNAALLLALVGNASEIQWRYTTGADRASVGVLTGSLTESTANSLLGGNVKTYGSSAEQIQALLDRLDAGIPALDGNRAQGSPAASASSGTSAADLESCVSAAIMSSNANHFLKGEYATESHTVLKTVESGNTVTVYAVALYLEFNYTDGVPSDISGSHMPVAITFEKGSGGKYQLKEYWEPKDGSNYSASIQSKFPSDITESALSMNDTLSQMQACYAKAIQHGKVDTDAALSKLLKTVCSSPAGQSNLKAYLDAHPVEYQQMTYYGSYALRWCFSHFEKGGQTGLEGSVMASVCRDILGKTEAGKPAATGQEWYDAFQKSVIEMRQKNGDDYMKQNCPGAWLLLQTLGETTE